jgi:acyl carrier protein
MNEDHIKAEVMKLIEDQFSFPRTKIRDALGPGDLPRWDSIGHMQLVRRLENHFNISFSVFDIMELNSIKDIWSTVNRLLKDQS